MPAPVAPSARVRDAAADRLTLERLLAAWTNVAPAWQAAVAGVRAHHAVLGDAPPPTTDEIASVAAAVTQLDVLLDVYFDVRARLPAWTGTSVDASPTTTTGMGMTATPAGGPLVFSAESAAVAQHAAAIDRVCAPAAAAARKFRGFEPAPVGGVFTLTAPIDVASTSGASVTSASGSRAAGQSSTAGERARAVSQASQARAVHALETHRMRGLTAAVQLHCLQRLAPPVWEWVHARTRASGTSPATDPELLWRFRLADTLLSGRGMCRMTSFALPTTAATRAPADS